MFRITVSYRGPYGEDDKEWEGIEQLDFFDKGQFIDTLAQLRLRADRVSVCSFAVIKVRHPQSDKDPNQVRGSRG